jgi:OOP family OmpA-OmpF porin
MNLKFTIASLVVLAQALTAQPLNNLSLSRTNSPYDELNPVISPDGKTLFITIANHPQNLGGRKDPGDIWYCTLTATNDWTEPVHAGSLINDRGFNTIAGFSTNGQEMVLMGHYDPSGNLARSQGISIAQKSGDGWARPRNVSIPYFQNKSSFISGYISSDLNTLVYSAEAYGSYGVEDIFVCHRNTDGKWSEPKNVGAKINSSFQELCPSLSADGKTLFFSTNGRTGKGSFDIYSANRLDDSWTSWTDPQNIGDMNSDGRDLFYRQASASGFALFTSTKNSDGYGDVKMFGAPNTIAVDSSQVVADSRPTLTVEQPPTTAPHSVKIYGKVINAKTGESVPATISFEPQADFVGGPGLVKAESTGYSMVVPSSAQYVVKVESKGFISSREKLDIQTYEMKDLEMNFKLQPIEVGTTVELKDVLFEQSRTALLPQSFPELDLVVSFMKSNPDVKIDLAGHTDNRGIPSQNVKLSQGRVDKVKEYLISKGISARRISGKGYGGNKPIASNENEETRKLNRRVEFTIRKN